MSRKGHNKSYIDNMYDHLQEYRTTHGDGPVRMENVAVWMLNEKKWQPEHRRVLKELARHLSAAARAKHHKDPQGRRVRTMHAAKYPKGQTADGQLLFETMWDHIETMSAEHGRVSFQQRHHQIAGECRSLKRDQDSFNVNNPNAHGHESQLSFNFELDLEEYAQPSVDIVEPS